MGDKVAQSLQIIEASERAEKSDSEEQVLS